MRNLQRAVATCVALLAIAGLSAARSLSGSITVTNQSSRTIVHLYVAHANAEDWSDDRLSGSSIANGQSFTISNINWDEPQIKVIGEDQEGCFLSTVVDSNGTVTWTITNATAASCGAD
jgi:hypothetical protein